MSRTPARSGERTFAINWQGVYFCARTFLPLLIASGNGVLVNTSSVAGFWATAGSGAPITAYCTSKFAIKGFSEALIEDLRSHAPQVRVVVVMPSVVNTDIATNSRRALGLPEWEQLSDAQLLELIPDTGRAVLIEMGLLPEDFSADDLRQAIPRLKDEFGDKGFSAVQAATIILDGVRSGAWRILVGEEAKMLDKQVRANPEAPFNYENYAEMYGPLIAQAQEQESGTPEPSRTLLDQYGVSPARADFVLSCRDDPQRPSPARHIAAPPRTTCRSPLTRCPQPDGLARRPAPTVPAASAAATRAAPAGRSCGRPRAG